MDRIHGLQISRFGLERPAVDDTDRHFEKAATPGFVFVFLDADHFTDERAADMDQVALPFDFAVGSHLARRIEAGRNLMNVLNLLYVL
ncbi:MAG: hypothetical protein ACLQIQ_01690 [Beijerinckiaceae bacterium]